MNEETLENLLIDRALGQLSPDVEALLDDYLARNPQATCAAGELADTVALAGSALRSPAANVKPPCRLRRSSPFVRIRPALAMAASFAVGAGVSAIVLRGISPPHAPASGHRVAEASVQSQSSPRIDYARTAPSIRALPFWSKERAFALAQHSQTTNP